MEEHLNWDIYFSKKWKYLIHKLLTEKRIRRYMLPMEPVNSTQFKEMKDEIEKLEKINIIKSEDNKEIV